MEGRSRTHRIPRQSRARFTDLNIRGRQAGSSATTCAASSAPCAIESSFRDSCQRRTVSRAQRSLYSSQRIPTRLRPIDLAAVLGWPHDHPAPQQEATGRRPRTLPRAGGGGEWDDAHTHHRRDDLRRLRPRAFRGRGAGAGQPHRQGRCRRLPQRHGGGPGHRWRRRCADAGPRQLPRAPDLPQHGRGLLRDRRAPGGRARLPHHAQREGDAGRGLHRLRQRLVREGPARHRDPQRDQRRRHPGPPDARGQRPRSR